MSAPITLNGRPADDHETEAIDYAHACEREADLKLLAGVLSTGESHE